MLNKYYNKYLKYKKKYIKLKIQGGSKFKDPINWKSFINKLDLIVRIIIAMQIFKN